MNAEQVMQSVEKYTQKYIDFLCDICAFEARAKDIEVMNRLADFIADFAKAEGFQVKRTPMEECGDFLTVELNEGAPKGCFLLAHMDTVHDAGIFGEPAVRVEEDRIVGPGTIDCKGGIAIALLVMKALQENGVNKHVRLILTSDEEVSNKMGGQKEIQFIKDSCQGFPYAINCEIADEDQAVISRKGILRYRLDIHGEGGHSGKHYFNCKNAVLEAAHKIIALHGKSEKGGTTYSCNIVNGGTALNVIPPECSVSIDIRMVTTRDMLIAKQVVEEIAATDFVPGTTCDAVLLSERLPMERNAATDALFQKLLDTCHKHNLGSLTPIESGAGSDSCYTHAAGVASICGMGGCGEFCHTNKEYIRTDSVALRAKILSAFITED